MKVDGSLGSLVQGVSQQTPTERRLGQHGEQVNMLADPVKGLTRRHGSVWLAERDMQLEPLNLAANIADTASFRSFDYTSQGKDYTVLYRSAAQVAGSDVPAVVVYNKTDNEFLPLVRNVSDSLLDELESGGVSAIAAVGKYVFFGGSTIVPQGTSTDTWGDATNQAQTVLWVRGGAYARTYKATVTKVDNSQVSFEYTTPTSSYPGTLDTSGVSLYALDPAGGTNTAAESLYIRAAGGGGEAFFHFKDWSPTSETLKKGTTTMTNTHPVAPATALEYSWSGTGSDPILFTAANVNATDITAEYTKTNLVLNPNYTRQVQDLTNDYNTAVTQWIGTAAAAIQPENIAESLKDAATTAGLTGVTRSNATVVFTGVKDITFSDSGDGSLLKGLANTCQAVSDLTDEHYVGKVVKVSPTSGESFYMKATAKNASITSGVTEVRWVEGAGIDRTIDEALVYGVVDSGTFYIAGSATLLDAILPGDHPEYLPATVGDDDTSPMPYFVGRGVDYLGVFQDRLLVGSRGVIRGSKTGDYLNFFRGSVLTVSADDAFEMLSQGSEDDTIRYSALYDRDLILFGKRQYAVSGRAPLTPTSANMPVMSSHAGADDAPPVAAGGLLFYAKQGQEATSVHQIEPGRNAESPESYPASSQLDKYMTGRPVELLAVPKPSSLLVRTSGYRNGLFVYSYLDSSQERRQDCWHRWLYAESIGPIIGMSNVREGVVLFSFRSGEDEEGDVKQWIVADLQSLDPQLSSRPYLDSLRSWTSINSDPGSHHIENAALSVAYKAESDRFLLGAEDIADAPALIEDLGDETLLDTGHQFESYWTPTNPALRGQDGKAIKTGRLVVARLVAAFTDSSGFRSVVTFQNADTEYRFNGRILGDPNNVIGRVPVTDGVHNIPVGRASREYTQTIHALTWLPLNLTSVEWEGQSFHRPQRVS